MKKAYFGIDWNSNSASITENPKKLLDTVPLVIQKYESQTPISNANLFLLKCTGGRYPKRVPLKVKKQKYYFECPEIIGINFSSRLPKKLNKYILHSKNFCPLDTYIENSGRIFYNLNFPKVYDRILTPASDVANETEWYLVLSSHQEILDKVQKEIEHGATYLLLYERGIQLISDKEVPEYLNRLEKIRPDFAKEIRLYLEVI